MTGLADAVAGWAPDPLDATDTITPWPVAALSAVFDLPGPVGETLPPLWHWLYFLEHARQSDQGEDGHPADGHFLPPIPDRRRMFAGGRLRVHGPLHVGDTVHRRSELAGVRVKHGRSGDMVFVTVRSSLSVGGRAALTDEQDFVYRSQPPGAARSAAPAAAAEPEAPHRWRVEVPTDPTLLFRFSALTFNSHRIHYDQPYATGVEGFPGLVVHGPLLAMAALEIPRRELPDRTVTAVDYRLVRPAFAGGLLVATGTPDDAGLSLTAGIAGAGASLTASARFDGT